MNMTANSETYPTNPKPHQQSERERVYQSPTNLSKPEMREEDSNLSQDILGMIDLNLDQLVFEVIAVLTVKEELEGSGGVRVMTEKNSYQDLHPLTKSFVNDLSRCDLHD
jgi:hypothetical protein